MSKAVELRAQARDTLNASAHELRRAGELLLRLPDGGADGFRCLRAAHDCEKLAQGILPYHLCSAARCTARGRIGRS